MSNVRLSQIIAVTGGLGARATTAYGSAEKALSREDLFNGLRRSFEPTEVDGRDVVAPPPEVKHVQKDVTVVLDEAFADIGDWFDACLTRDVGNTLAKASVVVDGVTIVEDAPVPFLLFLADQLGHIRKLLASVPTLSADKVWTENLTNGEWESELTYTNSYKTVKEPLVLHPGTDKHPPQVSITDKEIYQGRKVVQQQSTALPEVRKTALLHKVSGLHDAVKQAIQEANASSVPQQKVGNTLFAWLTTE